MNKTEYVFIVVIILLIVIVIIQHYNSAPIFPLLDKIDRTLINPTTRGVLGERILTDVLQAYGLIQGIHFILQKEIGNVRPDCTLLLPNQRTLNIDAKFPLSNYLKAVESNDLVAKGRFEQDVLSMLRDVVERGYISEDKGTLNFAVVFIPNEIVYNFILENYIKITDFCIKNRLVMCGPLSIGAILNIVHSMFDYHTLTADQFENIERIKGFEKSWNKYKEEHEKVVKKSKELADLTLALSELRSNSVDLALRGT